jgi:hypothetical protein
MILREVIDLVHPNCERCHRIPALGRDETLPIAEAGSDAATRVPHEEVWIERIEARQRASRV